LKNYYKILEIDDLASLTEIHSAYRRLAKFYHPDVNPHYVHADEMFKLVNEAYGVLSNSQKRMAYDSQLKRSDKTTDNFTSKPADDAERSKKESTHFGNPDDYWFPGGAEYSEDYQLCDTDNAFEGGKRLLQLIKVVYLLDICLGAFFIYYIGRLDLSIVPKVYMFFGWWSWLVDLGAGINCQTTVVLLSLFQLSLLLFNRIPIFYTISHFLKAHEQYITFLVVQALLKFVTAFFFISPMFGITLFELSGKIFFIAILWNAFMGIFLLTNIMAIRRAGTLQ
jgi:hypothetical protein